MSESLNPKIINKLKEIESNEAIKEFLKEMLYYELQIFEEGRPRFSKRYDDAIKKYLEVYLKEDKNEI